jgi:hypothetical protein
MTHFLAVLADRENKCHRSLYLQFFYRLEFSMCATKPSVVSR